MNKIESLAMKCKKISRHNTKCWSILMELIDAGRADLVDAICRLMNQDYNALTPEQIVTTYTECGGKEGFVKRCNKIFNKRSLKHEQSEYDYEESLKRYNCGEQQYHPDGSRFETDGTEITYYND